MLDNLFELIDQHYGDKTFFMGLAFKFETGIAIVDYRATDDSKEGYVVDWVSFIDIEKHVSALCDTLEELKTAIEEFAL